VNLDATTPGVGQLSVLASELIVTFPLRFTV
jgi:hypothetical protein